MTHVNGKVSHRKIGEATAEALGLANQHAQVINSQGLKLKAYGERLADALTRLDALERRVAVLEPTPEPEPVHG